MVSVVRWLNWVILPVDWFCSSFSAQHLVVYTIDLQERIHLLLKLHPSCCNTKTSPYPAKVGWGSVISWRCRAWDKTQDDIASLRPVVTSPPIAEASMLDFRLNQNGYRTSIQTIKQWKYCWYLVVFFVFFRYIWFIDSENLYFILILKDKMTRFWHLILFISLILK